MTLPSRAELEGFLHGAFVAAEGTRLRVEDERKVDELHGMLQHLAASLRRASRKRRFVLVDAAAGKGYLGLAAARFLLEPRDAPYEVVLLERDPRRVAQALDAAARLGLPSVRGVVADVDDGSAYPEAPSLVVALHACGDASDAVLRRSAAAGAQAVCVVPCCVPGDSGAARRARTLREALGLPRSAPIERRLVHAVLDGSRLLALEAAGYEAQAVEVFAPTVSPYNVALIGRRVGDPLAIARAEAALAALDLDPEPSHGR